MSTFTPDFKASPAGSPASVEELKALLSAYHAPYAGRDAQAGFELSLLPSPLPRGALIELSGTPGNGKTETLLHLIQENPETRVAWIEIEWTLYPNAFFSKRISPERVLLIESGNDHKKGPLWIAHQILKAQVFDLLIINLLSLSESALPSPRSPLIPERELRRLQLATQRNGSSVILLNDHPSEQKHWPIAVQLRATRSTPQISPTALNGSSGIKLEVLKFKGMNA